MTAVSTREALRTAEAVLTARLPLTKVVRIGTRSR